MGKAYRYRRGETVGWDEQFDQAQEFGKVRVGADVLFWKEGMWWHGMPLDEVQRFYRQVEPVYGRLCCGGRSYVIHRLIAVLASGTEMKLHIGDDASAEAEALLAHLKKLRPGIAFGKV